VLDYRRVNASSFSDRYALRTIDECLETVGRAGSKVYSALDCSSAFWQLELRPSDRPFTAFTIPGKGHAVPLEDVSARPDGSTSQFLKVGGRVVSGRQKRPNVH
jgi:hypothetical protein